METKTKEIKVDLFPVAPGVWGMKDVFVNVFAILNPSENNWFLVDAGMKWSAPKIKRMAELLFGAGSKPAAIILTHGHFDHVGSLSKLASEWDVQIYAHHLEMPYLTGVSSYPPPDPTVGGGLMADVSFLYPKGPINIEDRAISLPQGGVIPGLPEWKYIHTPGHAPGHISLFRESDKVLIAGDAIVTTKQESAIFVMAQLKKLSGPPKYFTCDWLSAAVSVEQLANLEPNVIATGHGRPMRGAGMRKTLHNLVRDFNKVAVPHQGRYVHQPALTDDTGVVHLPPKNKNANVSPTLKVLGVSAGILIAMMLFGNGKKKKKKEKKDAASSKHPVKQSVSYSKKMPDLKAPFKHESAKLKNSGKKQFNELKGSAKKEVNRLKNYGKEQFNELKGSGKKEVDRLKESGKKDFNQLKNSGKEELHKLKKSGQHELDKLKEPIMDNISHLKFPVRKGLRKIKRLFS